jgi:hypothetical protein
VAGFIEHGRESYSLKKGIFFGQGWIFQHLKGKSSS